VNDSDGDGVIDANDRCPGTPRGTRVSSDGCLAPSPIQFAFDSDALDARATRELDAVAGALERNPDLSLAITGFTDGKGDPAYNLALAERRAGAAKGRIVASGVASSRVATKARGAAGFLGANDTEEGRATNRRIELDLK
jgi:OOP family OmpA-OmpF porin